MDKFLTALGGSVLLIFLIGVIAVLNGTLLWLIWPIAIPVIFPLWVSTGVIAGTLSWKVAVLFTWICGILIKSTTTINK